jgi:uncharacterized protein DUF6247
VLAWLAVFEDDDRLEFFEELRDALSVAEATRDAAPVETCLREWRTTARALSDPLRHAILTGPGDVLAIISVATALVVGGWAFNVWRYRWK